MEQSPDESGPIKDGLRLSAGRKKFISQHKHEQHIHQCNDKKHKRD